MASSPWSCRLVLHPEEGSNSGIAQVDFYIDNKKVGSAKNSTGNLFQTIIDLEPLSLGRESMKSPWLPAIRLEIMQVHFPVN